MDLRSAAGMILEEAAGHPDLLRMSRLACDEFAAGREVAHPVLSGMLGEAARKGVFPALKRKHGERVVDDMITALAREIDRQAPVVRR